MDEVEALIARLREDGQRVWVAGPQSEEAITALEQALGLPLPPSYRQFVARYGGFGLPNSFVSGVIDGDPLEAGTGQVYWDTQRFRREYGMPDYLLVVQADGDAPYCLDTRKRRPDGELPVVCYELHSRHTGRMAPSFGEWFVGYLRLRVPRRPSQELPPVNDIG